MSLLLLKCPKCGNKMKYSPAKSSRKPAAERKKSKKCVYCGKTFKVEDNIVEVLKA